jgi:hypothetical protein
MTSSPLPVPQQHMQQQFWDCCRAGRGRSESLSAIEFPNLLKMPHEGARIISAELVGEVRNGTAQTTCAELDA